MLTKKQQEALDSFPEGKEIYAILFNLGEDVDHRDSQKVDIIYKDDDEKKNTSKLEIGPVWRLPWLNYGSVRGQFISESGYGCIISYPQSSLSKPLLRKMYDASPNKICETYGVCYSFALRWSEYPRYKNFLDYFYDMADDELKLLLALSKQS